jgi:hypothetical protein
MNIAGRMLVRGMNVKPIHLAEVLVRRGASEGARPRASATK